MNWYPRFPGDYMRDTAHLSLTEHGVYNVLLDHYYSTREPLPKDSNALMRICRAYEDFERLAVVGIADKYFPVNGDGKRHNKRADIEIARQDAISKKRSKNGLKGAESRWEKQTDSNCHNNCHSNGMASDTTPTATTTDNNQKPQPEPEPETRVTFKGDVYTSEFIQFWNTYPNKKGKKAAWRAWKQAKDRPPIDKLIAEVELQSRSVEWGKDGGAYIPHPATWLNRGGWEDVVTVIGYNPEGGE